MKETTAARQNTSKQEIYENKIVIITTVIMTTETVTIVLSTAVAVYKGKYSFYNKKIPGLTNYIDYLVTSVSFAVAATVMLCQDFRVM
jgi:hypothetical protein